MRLVSPGMRPVSACIWQLGPHMRDPNTNHPRMRLSGLGIGPGVWPRYVEC